jgi:hypothetical protein
VWIPRLRLAIDSSIGTEPEEVALKVENYLLGYSADPPPTDGIARLEEFDERMRADREETQARLDIYRRWSDHAESLASQAALFVRQEFTRLDEWSDPALAAVLALYTGQLDRAQKILAVIKRQDWHDDLLRAVVDLELGHKDEAVEHCDAVLLHRPFDVDAELLRAEIEREIHGPAAARLRAEEIVRRCPNNVDAQILVADCCYDLASVPDRADRAPVDVALLTESARWYRSAIELSDNLREFLRRRGRDVAGPVGSRWLGTDNYQRAVLPQDSQLNALRDELLSAISDKALRHRLQRSVWQYRGAKARRWGRNGGTVVGACGVLLLLLIPVLGYEVPWEPEHTLLLLGACVFVALFATFSEFSMPGGIGFKRQVMPAEETDLQPSELQRSLSSLSRRSISSSALLGSRAAQPKERFHSRRSSPWSGSPKPDAKIGATTSGRESPTIP